MNAKLYYTVLRVFFFFHPKKLGIRTGKQNYLLKFFISSCSFRLNSWTLVVLWPFTVKLWYLCPFVNTSKFSTYFLGLGLHTHLISTLSARVQWYNLFPKSAINTVHLSWTTGKNNHKYWVLNINTWKHQPQILPLIMDTRKPQILSSFHEHQEISATNTGLLSWTLKNIGHKYWLPVMNTRKYWPQILASRYEH